MLLLDPKRRIHISVVVKLLVGMLIVIAVVFTLDTITVIRQAQDALEVQGEELINLHQKNLQQQIDLARDKLFRRLNLHLQVLAEYTRTPLVTHIYQRGIGISGDRSDLLSQFQSCWTDHSPPRTYDCIEKHSLDLAMDHGLVATFNRNFVKITIDTLLRDEDILAIVVVDWEDQIYMGLAKQSGGEIRSIQHFGDLPERIIWEEAEVTNENDPVGKIMIGYTVQRLLQMESEADRSFNEAVKQVASNLEFRRQQIVKDRVLEGMLVLLILMVALSLLIYWMVLRPLNALRESALQFSQGNLDHDIDTSRQDELGLLADHFATMRDAIRKQIAELRAVNRASEAMLGIHDPPEILKLAIRFTKEQLQVEHASILLANDQNELVLEAWYPESEHRWKDAKKKFKIGEGVAGIAALEKRVVFIPDVSKDARFVQPEKAPHDSVSLLCIPLMDEEQLYGVINFSSSVGNMRFEENEQSLVLAIARLTVVMIKNIKMLRWRLDLKATQSAQTRLLEQHRITKEVTSVLNLQEATQLFIRRVVEVLRPDGSGSVLLYDSSKNVLALHASHGLSKEHARSIAYPATPEGVFSFEVFENQQSYVYEADMLPSFSYAVQQAHFNRPIAQQIVVPLIWELATIGLVTLTHYAPDKPFSDHDLAMLENLSLSLSHHFGNAKLYEEALRKEQEIADINHVMQTVNATLNVDTVMASFQEALKEILQFDAILVQLVDKSHVRMDVCHGYGQLEDEQIRKYCEIPISLKGHDSLTASIYQNKKPLYLPPGIEDFPVLPADRRIYDIQPMISALFLPLIVQNKVIGCLDLLSFKEGFHLEVMDIEKIQRYVTQIATAINNANLHEELQQTQFQLSETEKIAALTQIFQKFVPVQFLKLLGVDHLGSIQRGLASDTFITLLFCDIRGFTSIAEKTAAAELFDFLNDYIQHMGNYIEHHNGFVDKFIGDAIMAIFKNTEGDSSQDVEDALEAAIDMQTGLAKYNQTLKASGRIPIQVGIGIHSGPITLGTLGSGMRMETTVIGDTVNLASRLEGLTRHYGASIIVSYETFNLLHRPKRYKYRELDWLRVKGRTEPVGIYEIYNADPPELQKIKKRSSRMLQQALIHRQMRQWDQAFRSLDEALEIYPEDAAAQIQYRHCLKLRETPPSDDWDGSVDMDVK